MYAVGLFFFATVAAVGASAGDNACADPRAPRVGLIVRPEQSKPSDPDYVKRAAAVGRRFEAALAKFLGAGTCIVHDVAIFDDPQNYPALKGSIMLNITVSPSFRNPKVAAIAVEVMNAEGPDYRENFHLGAVPVLIESDSDFDTQAEDVLRWQCGMAARLSHPSDPDASKDCWESPPRRPPAK